jgi:hypothetical protein
LGGIVELSLRSTNSDSETSHPLARDCLGSQRTGWANGRSRNGYKRTGLTFTLRARCVLVRPKENVRPRPDARGLCAKEIVLISHGALVRTKRARAQYVPLPIANKFHALAETSNIGRPLQTCSAYGPPNSRCFLSRRRRQMWNGTQMINRSATIAAAI